MSVWSSRVSDKSANVVWSGPVRVVEFSTLIRVSPNVHADSNQQVENVQSNRNADPLRQKCLSLTLTPTVTPIFRPCVDISSRFYPRDPMLARVPAMALCLYLSVTSREFY